MEQARQRVIGAPGSPFSVPFMEPAVDVYETEDAVVIIAEIAGIGQEEVELEVEGTICILRGERNLGEPALNAIIVKWKLATGPSCANFCYPRKLTQTPLRPSIRTECCK